MTYTQGPWTIDYAMNDYEGHYLNGAGRLVAMTNTVENEVTDEDRANARLIASAPDLLEALNKAISELTLSLNFEKGYPDTIQVVKQGMEARKKATGQDDDIEYPEVEA